MLAGRDGSGLAAKRLKKLVGNAKRARKAGVPGPFPPPPSGRQQILLALFVIGFIAILSVTNYGLTTASADDAIGRAAEEPRHASSFRGAESGPSGHVPVEQERKSAKEVQEEAARLKAIHGKELAAAREGAEAPKWNDDAPPPKKKGRACDWTRHADAYLGEVAGGDDVREMVKGKAMEACRKMANVCLGITCSDDMDKFCTPRLGTPYLEHSLGGEVSYLSPQGKGCGFSSQRRQWEEWDAAATAAEEAALAAETAQPPRETAGPQGWTGALGMRSSDHPDGLTQEPLGPGKAVVVIIAHNKPDCLAKCLKSLVSQHGIETVKVAVSLDDPPSFGKMQSVVEALQGSAGSASIAIWKKPADQDRSKIKSQPVSKISEHFRFALTQAFDVQGHEFAIFVENDLTLSPDALWYFRSTAWLLERDESLFCVSAWNDNGFKGLVSDEQRLFRTDYFPGLGWMIHRNTWELLRDQWPRFPSTGWDHWLRHGSGLRPRECIVPEVSRTHHFDDHGTNVQSGSDLHKALESMVASKLPAGKLGDLSYLFKDRYDASLTAAIAKADLRRQGNELENTAKGILYVVPYVREDYKSLSKKLGIVQSQPRTAHRGLVLTRHPKTSALIALVDRRQAAGWLPQNEQWLPNVGQRRSKANQGESCDGLCKRLGMACKAEELEFVNNCPAMREAFPCEDGCGHQVGTEIPAYVHNSGQDTALQCLVTDDAISTCGAKHVATTRLCACVPR